MQKAAWSKHFFCQLDHGIFDENPVVRIASDLEKLCELCICSGFVHADKPEGHGIKQCLPFQKCVKVGVANEKVGLNKIDAVSGKELS